MSKLKMASGDDAPLVLRHIRNSFFQQHLLCQLAPNGWIAGGAIRSRLAKDGESDYDCYFASSSALDAASEKILSNTSLNAKIKINDANLRSFDTTLGKVDLVKKFFSSPIKCLEDFDFTVCCFAIDCDKKIYWLDQGLQDLENRKLVLYNPNCGLGSMIRLQKYALKGYKMEIDEYEKLAKIIKERDISATVEKIKSRGGLY